ncbi:CsoS2 family carboxysome shell protein [Cyanobium sp. WAJ14-Wanaka]|uniref:carboxysome assembly protein CsoS2 n=1 Tax=Cyanobium sp. WAJ14-Wanaka TaxID=2823725 RepID=UPI0020CC3F46|nr:CsoS2 family carboxysome shell protein [Cyanobium sp. WAJ14-Wanaka]MCP9774799.1 CsoS2 family carboxysome shell protein [Cyanobium sp. WAJ14-Wanaka]
MASTSSREAAIERRKALTNGGKKAVSRYTSAPSRVRTVGDARPTRTGAAEAAPAKAAPSQAAPSQAAHAPARAASRSLLGTAPAAGRRSPAKPVSNPSRELVLARREALAKGGKRADTSKDRTRTDFPKAAPVKASVDDQKVATESARSAVPQLSLSNPAAKSADRRVTAKRTAITNPSRALVLARRESLSKRGKSASTPSSTSAAAVARQGNSEMTGRELSQKVRELKAKVGSAGTSRSGGTRPSGPNIHGSKQAAAAEAHWKVGVSETTSGQVVTGTQANRSVKTTGNEASTCRSITGTEYMGAEIFRTFCKSEPSPSQPAKVRVTDTSHGNRVTGNEVGRSEKVTGDEPGTCKNVTGTEYVSANQMASYCGGGKPSPRKVGRSQTQSGQAVSGVMVGRSEKVTGDESGSGKQLTGSQYVGDQSQIAGRAPTKVSTLNTLRGTGITGTHVGRSQHVTGDEPGSCRMVTGDEYVGSQQYDSFCGTKPAPEAAKVGFSVTNRAQVVSGTRTGRSEKVTGDEPGSCKVVTGTPYAGLDQAGSFCNSNQIREIRQRTPVRGSNRMSGIQPGIGGVMTGAGRGACESISGTPYIGSDQLAEACGAASATDADFPQALGGSQPWQQFSVQSPARVAHTAREQSKAVTGTSYEQGSRITGPFDMAGDKVTGTEQFRFDRRGAQFSRGPVAPEAAHATVAPVSVDEDARPVSRVTGEGISAGLKITGDDWDRGDRVTGTEGVSARRRNPTRTGPMSAMAGQQPKRNDAVPEPVSRVTGSSGNTSAGSLITVSGGARG